MTLDEIDQRLGQYSVSQREERLRIGRGFGSDLTVAQANQTLNGLKKYKAELATRGFPQSNVDELIWCRDAIGICLGGRGVIQVINKVTNKALMDKMKLGKAIRMELRSVFQDVAESLEEKPDDESAQELALTVRTTLEKTSSAGADPLKLAEQLERYLNLAQQPTVAALLSQNASALVTEATTVAQEIRDLEAKSAGPRGTPAESQRLDLVDGRIVQLVRKARASARAAARKLGDEAIAKAFELSALYPE
ncbi:MAG: hypothetical protein HUU55_03060 [Myxococcales bacterium]|nr:hypothetical protein [Myxococcales bacterium]